MGQWYDYYDDIDDYKQQFYVKTSKKLKVTKYRANINQPELTLYNQG